MKIILKVILTGLKDMEFFFFKLYTFYRLYENLKPFDSVDVLNGSQTWRGYEGDRSPMTFFSIFKSCG